MFSRNLKPGISIRPPKDTKAKPITKAEKKEMNEILLRGLQRLDDNVLDDLDAYVRKL